MPKSPRERVLERIGEEKLKEIEARHQRIRQSEEAAAGNTYRRSESGRYGSGNELLRGVGPARDMKINKALEKAGAK